MITNHTHPSIRSHLLTLLRRWIANEPPPPPSSAFNHSALQAQTTLGGWNTLLGRISTQITALQSRHYHLLASRRTGFRWTVGLIHQLQNLTWDMWDHRNAVKNNDPTRHFQRDELDAANQAIAEEWEQGDTGLLQQDRFLFRSRTGVNQKTLPQKWEWLAFVSAARAAAAAEAGSQNTYEHERAFMRGWVRRKTTTLPRIRDDPETQNKTNETRQKQQKTTKSRKNNTSTRTRASEVKRQAAEDPRQTRITFSKRPRGPE